MHSTHGKENDRYFTLNVRIIEIFLHLSDWLDDRSIPIEKFLEFIESLFRSLLPWQAFTGAFINCKVESKLTLAYLSAIEEMLDPVKSDSFMSPNMLGSQVTWIQHLPKMLLQLGDKHPSTSKVGLNLLLRIGQRSPPNSTFGLEYDNLQFSLKGVYSNIGFNDDMAVDEAETDGTIKIDKATHSKDTNNEHTGDIQYHIFLKLPKDCQELAVCSLYYISSLSSDFILSLTDCCLSNTMELEMLLRIIDVLHSAYRSGHLHISEHMGFFLTLVARKKISDGDGELFNQRAYKSLNSAVCSCLSQMGDNTFVLKLMFKSIINEMSRKLPVDNMYGLFRMIASLDPMLTKLSEENIDNLSNWLSVYLVDITLSHMATQTNSQSDSIRKFRYYVQPCIYICIGNSKVLARVLKFFNSLLIDDNILGSERALSSIRRVYMVCSILIFMHDDERLDKILPLNKVAIRFKCILQNVPSILVSDKYAWTLEEKHDMQNIYDRLESRTMTNLKRV